ncbi:UNVERIFIED_CONTAM: hypothetical protein Sradi_3211300 [Sesamum radiatum]|uniref:Endonuclease/exonuclease/phosphatase family protein n=1 Tax=Sesamum radiatum TaxID=300843 RepID=A0AAW2RGV4_SESRA
MRGANCQGLGSPRSVHILNELIRLYNPALIFLSETKYKTRKCENLKEIHNLFGVSVDSQDLGFSGHKFTWCNQREVSNTVRVRLDQACAMLCWRAMFPNVQVVVEAVQGSDHSPLIIDLEATREAQWLRDGDRNIPYFHARASARKRKNFISRLRNKEGDWCYSQKGIQHIVYSYFHDLFQTSGPSNESIDAVLKGMPTRVGEDMNEALVNPLSSDEMVNLEKSSIAFSCNTLSDLQADLASIPGVGVVVKHEKYLGASGLSGTFQEGVGEVTKLNVQEFFASGCASSGGRARELVHMAQHPPGVRPDCSWPNDVEVIVGITIAVGSPDQLLWHFEMHGWTSCLLGGHVETRFPFLPILGIMVCRITERALGVELRAMIYSILLCDAISLASSGLFHISHGLPSLVFI